MKLSHDIVFTETSFAETCLRFQQRLIQVQSSVVDYIEEASLGKPLIYAPSIMKRLSDWELIYEERKKLLQEIQGVDVELVDLGGILGAKSVAKTGATGFSSLFKVTREVRFYKGITAILGGSPNVMAQIKSKPYHTGGPSGRVGYELGYRPDDKILVLPDEWYEYEVRHTNYCLTIFLASELRDCN